MSAETEIKQVLAQKARALIQQSALQLEELLDPNFIYVNSYGKKLNKQQYIDHCCTSGVLRFLQQNFEQVEIRDYGSFAVATMIIKDEFEYSGTLHRGSFLSLCVFRRLGTVWRWAAGQTSEISQA